MVAIPHRGHPHRHCTAKFSNPDAGIAAAVTPSWRSSSCTRATGGPNECALLAASDQQFPVSSRTPWSPKDLQSAHRNYQQPSSYQPSKMPSVTPLDPGALPVHRSCQSPTAFRDEKADAKTVERLEGGSTTRRRLKDSKDVQRLEGSSTTRRRFNDSKEVQQALGAWLALALDNHPQYNISHKPNLLPEGKADVTMRSVQRLSPRRESSVITCMCE